MSVKIYRHQSERQCNRMFTVKRAYIFVSIPRSASSTVHFLLGLNGPRNESAPTDWGVTDNHASCDTLIARYGREEFDRRYRFTFVRNPWDRCVSWYCYHAR